MTSEKVEYARIRAASFSEAIDLIKYTIGKIAIVAAIWFIFDGLSKVMAGHDADGITAFAKVLEALHVGSILGYVGWAGTAIAWRRERAGKKRAIREKSRYQKIAEATDINRTSSGLNETGDTPYGGE